MGKPSKEYELIELFFNEPSRQWHFKELVTLGKISENRANYWLKNMLKEKLIIYNKVKGKMPYYTSNTNHTNYRIKKKLYALETFYETGFLKHLESLNAKTIVLFGSFSRSDWNKKSDIDIFILGTDDDLEKGKYENILQREIQIYTAKDAKKININLAKNILNGYFIKGEIQNILGELRG